MMSFRAAAPGNVNVGFAENPVEVWRNTLYVPVPSSTVTRSVSPSPSRSPTTRGPVPGAGTVLSYTAFVGKAYAGAGAHETSSAANASTRTGAKTRRARRFMGRLPSAPDRGPEVSWGTCSFNPRGAVVE